MAFFTVIAKPVTWRSAGYLLLAYPLGLLYFIFLVTGFSLGFGLVITLIGIPILVGMMSAVYGLGEFERLITNGLLETDIPHTKRLAQAEGFWGKLKALLASSETWKRLFYLILKFPFGIFGLVLVAVTFASFAQVAAPLFYQQEWYSPQFGGAWEIDELWQAFAVAVVGVLLGFLLLHVINGTARVWGLIANALLGPTHAAAGDQDQQVTIDNSTKSAP